MDDETASQWPGTAEGYKELFTIGTGTYATVLECVVRTGEHAGQHVAIKIVDLSKFPHANADDIKKELATASLPAEKHPIVTYKKSFIYKNYLWLVMPLLDGGSCQNLLKHLRPDGIKDMCVLSYILKKTCEALLYLHQNEQIHRDLKAGNVLLTKEGEVFVADFGVAASLKDEQTRCTFVGTPCWMAPEVLQSNPYNTKADIWSLGILAIELCNGHAPLQDKPPLKVMMMVMHKEPPSLDANEWGHCPLLIAFVKACLQKEPEARPSVEELLLQHADFFAQSSGGDKALAEVLKQMPPLDKRLPIIETDCHKGFSYGSSNFDNVDRKEEDLFAGFDEAEKDESPCM